MLFAGRFHTFSTWFLVHQCAYLSSEISMYIIKVVCVSACLRVCVSACLRVCVSACLRVCVSACLRV